MPAQEHLITSVQNDGMYKNQPYTKYNWFTTIDHKSYTSEMSLQRVEISSLGSRDASVAILCILHSRVKDISVFEEIISRITYIPELCQIFIKIANII